MADPARAAAARNYLASIGVRVPAPRRRPVADVPGTLPGLADAYARPVELSAAEIQRNAEYARAQEAAAQRDTSYDVSPNEMIRDLGIIAQNDVGIPGAERAANAVAGSGALRGALSAAVPGLAPLMALGDVEYDPVALASSAVPLADEAMAAGESVLGGRSYREAQAQREQQFAEARERSPGSALVGSLAQGIVAAPVASSITAAQGAAAGTALGAAGGFLGSEGMTPVERATETVEGALTGGALGTYAGGLSQGGRLVAEGGRSALGTIGRGLLGGTAEGAGYGIGQGAIESGGRIGSREQLRDAATGGGLGGAMGSVPGLVGGIARLARSRGSVPGLADDAREVATGDLAELSEMDLPETIEPLQPTGPQDMADIDRLRAAGAINVTTMNRIAREFGGGMAGIRRAAEIARRSGISPRGITRLNTTASTVERNRVEAQRALSRFHNEIGDAGEMVSGEELATPMEEYARGLARDTSPDALTSARIRSARERADVLRYGGYDENGRAITPNRAEIDRLRALEYADPNEIGLREWTPPLPGTTIGSEAEVIAPRLADAVEPQRIPYQESRAVERTLGGRIGRYNQPNQPADLTPRELLDAEYNARVRARQAAGRRALGERYQTELLPENERFRLAAILNPENSIPNALGAQPGTLTRAGARIAEGGGFSPSGEAASWRERQYRQIEPSLNALISEWEAARAASPPSLGRYADRLRLASPENLALTPAAVGGAIGEGDAVGMARARAESDAVLRRIAAEEAAPQDDENGPIDPLDRLGLPTEEEAASQSEEEIDPLDMLGR